MSSDVSQVSRAASKHTDFRCVEVDDNELADTFFIADLIGVPFYPAGRDPKAVCPVCFKHRLEDGNESVTVPLYASKIGQLDPRIPKELFVPPDFESGAEDSCVFEVTKFQYKNLLRFAAFKARETEVWKSGKGNPGRSSLEVDKKDDGCNMATISSPTSSVEEDLHERESAQDAAKRYYISPVSIASKSVCTGLRDISIERHSDDDKDRTGGNLNVWQPYAQPDSRTFSRRNYSSSRSSAVPRRSAGNITSPHSRPAVSYSEVKGGQLQSLAQSRSMFKKPLLSYQRRPGSPLFPFPKRQRRSFWKSATTGTDASPDVWGPIPFSLPNIRARKSYSKQVSSQSAEDILSGTPMHRFGSPVNPPVVRARKIDEINTKHATMNQCSKDWHQRKYNTSIDLKNQISHSALIDLAVEEPAFIGDSRILKRHANGSTPAINRRKTGIASRTMLAPWR
ncbi:hypothetical protein KEM54_006389 [Ascosphaera aggregata]|nr:hypothetical protein KEM54_006389 [Ascosphaera aggregata]